MLSSTDLLHALGTSHGISNINLNLLGTSHVMSNINLYILETSHGMSNNNLILLHSIWGLANVSRNLGVEHFLFVVSDLEPNYKIVTLPIAR